MLSKQLLVFLENHGALVLFCMSSYGLELVPVHQLLISAIAIPQRQKETTTTSPDQTI